MADAIVSIVMERVASIIEHEIEQEVRLIVGVEKEVEKLSTTLGFIRDVLDDAEEKQVRDKRVKRWLVNLKDVAYDIDDLLEEWSTEILRSQIEGVESATRLKKKVCSHYFSPCSSFNQVVFRRNLGHRITHIRERLDAVSLEKDNYNFSFRSNEEPERLKTSSVVDISEVCGRALDEANITSKLLSESSQNGTSLPFITSIVGMGGIGKTTLAQLAFNNEKVKTHFDIRIWVCVSEPFDQIMIVKAIIKAFSGYVPKDNIWEELLKSLLNYVKGKQFLLVLDDVWNEDHEKWEQLNLSLKHGAPGSRVLITTRNERVSQMMGVTHPYNLEVLSEQDCWSLLKRIAFWGRRLEECEGLEEIGKKIATKCKGVPLSAKALGGLLRSKITKQEWQEVLESKIWDLEEVEKGVLPSLLLSYYDLPSHLKCCFAYCAIFPKDFIIERDVLIKLWMAQGFINSKGSRELEIKGQEYFDNLMMRSFFQVSKRDMYGNIYYKMHDLVHDFAQFLTENECYIMERGDAKKLNLSKVRHSTVLGEFDSNLTLSSLCKAKKLRTLKVNIRGESISKLLPDLFNQLTCLRALDLSSTSIKELPSEVGKLVHLRYLDLSYTKLTELPKTMTNLLNLLTLKLTGCGDISKLPKGMEKLIRLRHIVNESTYLSLRGIGGLSSLRKVSLFIVGGASNCKIGELKNLNLLRGDLTISGLRSVENEIEAKEAELRNKQHLQKLELFFKQDEVNEERKKEVDEKMEGVIEGLQPPSNLESLIVSYYPATKFPENWMMKYNDDYMICSSLRSLSLRGCKKCLRLPPSLSKLPSLEELDIWEMVEVTNMGCDFLGLGDADYGTTKEHDGVSNLVAFPKLKTLKFRSMENWEEWDLTSTKGDDITIMPCLYSLELYNCPKLKALPNSLLQKNQNTPLGKLIINDCPILSQHYEKENGKDYNKISHIPTRKT